MSCFSVQKLRDCIEYRRKTLIELGLIQGFGDPIIIKLSEELDQLIFKYQKLTSFSKPLN
ncbi:aspartyl-phosphate phosphatase Spo0E family protein [Sutcliffiella rhizosphaerae]|uniref:Aspartyl-phosphate phosphatase Spo0E family protein n=1 Tax=Sutcliffiella rhizosphaerae TaxID=2880967 RepID=A0ABM8YKU5_9BACI|nr:aspartyl-phosphate phosphatase Spo0E family protein [Sutcliffiella rhizosphaerae]CAG9620491.1 hypothetical protein BACCIP111883_01260 [Sutcliffiella rhizosphaerae]